MTEVIDGKVYVFMSKDIETYNACKLLLKKKIKELPSNRTPTSEERTDGYMDCLMDVLTLLEES